MTRKQTEWALVYAYTRKEAIEDGLLVDVSQMAKKAGIAIPTAVTAAVRERYVAVPDAVGWQDETGRLWDVLWMLRCAVARGAKGSEVRYTVMVDNDGLGPRPVELKAVCGPGDDGEPVSTIMLPDED